MPLAPVQPTTQTEDIDPFRVMSVDQLKTMLESVNVDASTCKTQDDYLTLCRAHELIPALSTTFLVRKDQKMKTKQYRVDALGLKRKGVSFRTGPKPTAYFQPNPFSRQRKYALNGDIVTGRQCAAYRNWLQLDDGRWLPMKVNHTEVVFAADRPLRQVEVLILDGDDAGAWIPAEFVRTVEDPDYGLKHDVKVLPGELANRYNWTNQRFVVDAPHMRAKTASEIISHSRVETVMRHFLETKTFTRKPLGFDIQTDEVSGRTFTRFHSDPYVKYLFAEIGGTPVYTAHFDVILGMLRRSLPTVQNPLKISFIKTAMKAQRRT